LEGLSLRPGWTTAALLFIAIIIYYSICVYV